MGYSTIRTPVDRFKDLKDYPFDPNYIDIMGYQIHYVDEGNKDDPVILLLHGEPSWSYLYRKMIPQLVDTGFRVIAPDLVGFGKSDKLTSRGDYSYDLLVNINTSFVRKLDLTIEVLFIQDWGSLIGLRMLETVGGRIQRVLLANGGLPAASGLKGWVGHFLFKLRVKLTGEVSEEEFAENLNFVKWVAYSQTVEEFPVGQIIQGGSLTELDEDEIAAYNAPFPDESYKAGARQLPMLVSSQLRKNYQVWQDILKNWEKPFLTVFGKKDAITRHGEKRFIRKVPGAEGLDHLLLDDASHFIQEDQPDKLVEEIIGLSKIKIEEK